MADHQTEQQKNNFSCRINVDKVKSAGLHRAISATSDQRRALAQELNLNGIDELSLECVLKPWKKTGIEVNGNLSAVIEEICVVSLESFKTTVSEQVERFYEAVDASAKQSSLSDLEDLDDEVPDILEAGAIDIAEIAVETLALSLSPHPRKPGVVFTDHVESEPGDEPKSGKENPFEILKQLKKH